MESLQREYERFGPWVAPIETGDDIPQQFLRYRSTIENALYAVKIPINVERRNVRKGMPLYHTVVAFTEDMICLMQRTKADVDLTEISYRQILYFQHVSNILVGEFVLGTVDQIYVLTFNPVEIGPVEKAIRIIRQKYLDKVAPIDLDSIDENRDSKSALYETLIAREFKSDDIKVIEYQPYMGLEDRAGETVDPETPAGEPVLQDSLFLANEHELVVINRTKEIKLPREADYGYRYTYIPRNHILGITLEPEETNELIYNLSFILKEGKVAFLVGHDFSITKLKSALNI